MVSEPPVLPDGAEGRRWAEEELAGPGYQKPAPAWLENAWQAFLDWLGQLDGPSGPPSSVAGPLIAVAGVVIIVLAIVLVRPRLNARRQVQKEMYDAGTSVTADAYRGRAATAAAAGNLSAAVVDLYRALVRAAEEEEVIDTRPGRTADEAAAQLGRVYPHQSLQLASAAGTFDAVLYGHAAAGRADFDAMAELDEALQIATASAEGTAAPPPQGMQVPR